MQPGYYPTLSFEEYTKIAAASQSKLNKLTRCCADLKWHIDHPSEEDSAAMQLGRAVDCAITQPEEFESNYAAAPDVDKRTKSGKADWLEFAEANQGKQILKASDYERCLTMRDAVHKCNTARGLITGQVHFQPSIVWHDRMSSMLCKGRLDAWNAELETVIDIKTTRDASFFKFRNAVHQFGYHRQAAWYLDGMLANGKSPKHFVIIAVENEAPYNVAVYKLIDDKPDEGVQRGRKENEELLKKYRACLATNIWPGYPDDIQLMGSPNWVKGSSDLTTPQEF